MLALLVASLFASIPVAHLACFFFFAEHCKHDNRFPTPCRSAFHSLPLAALVLTPYLASVYSRRRRKCKGRSFDHTHLSISISQTFPTKASHADSRALAYQKRVDDPPKPHFPLLYTFLDKLKMYTIDCTSNAFTTAHKPQATRFRLVRGRGRRPPQSS